MENEILNIDYHVRSMVLKALNLFPTKMAAAKQLGISERNLYHYIDRFNIERDGLSRKYIIKSKQLV